MLNSGKQPTCQVKTERDAHMFSLDGKVALITGAGQGIGKSTAERFVAAGAKVVLADLQDASQLARDLDGMFIQTDVTSESSVHAALEAAVSAFGKLDILVNNAGVFADYKMLSDTEPEDFDFCYRVNTLGVAYGMKAAGALLADHGAIVNTASLAATRGVITLSSYVASKHAVVGLTKTAALELAPRKIRVNCICPSTVRTPMAYEGDGEAFLEQEMKTIPLERICEPEEAAALIHFLCADDCGFINGQAINLCGGASAGLSHTLHELIAQ